MAQSTVKVHIFSPSDKMSQESQYAVKALSCEPLIALDSEGVNLGKDGPMTLLQIGTLSGTVYLFDVMLNEQNQDKAYFRDTGLDRILTSKQIVKVIQSCSGDSAALFHQFGIRLENVFDTQVAHLVIEEHKGRLLPSRLKLAEICQKYSEHAKVYEGKDNLKETWTKREGNFWARRPMTDEMIDYASGDVTAMIPEVYEYQKRYLETYNLVDKFHDRVQEEIDYHIDPAAKDRRLQRQTETRRTILNRMSTKYRLGSDFSTLVDEDEKAIEDTDLTGMQAFPRAISDLKSEAIRQYLQQLEGDLTHPETFNPPRNLTMKLNEIEHGDDVNLKSYAARLKTQVIGMVTRDIEVKYNRDTSVEILTETEMHILRWLKPLSKEEPPYGPTVVALYWKRAERDVDDNLKKLRDDPEYEVRFPISKLRFFVSDQQVPRNIREKAHILLETFEGAMVSRIERKYSRSTQVSELANSEKMILAKLRITSKPYGQVVKSLHWKVTYENLCKDIQDYRQGKLQANDGLTGRIGFLASNQNVPPDVREKAKEFQRLLPRRQGRRR